jgi:tRNA dimethylallyltransferase
LRAHDSIPFVANPLTDILCIAGPTASGKSARALEEALAQNGEIISVDSRQVYRGLDIGTEKIPLDERGGIPHYLIDIREPQESYSAGDFTADATRYIADISARGKLPILVGGTHFYFDALLNPLPRIEGTVELRAELEKVSTEELYKRVAARDPRRYQELDPKNRRRLIRALEIIETVGSVPKRGNHPAPYHVEWIITDVPAPLLHKKIDERLMKALDRGLIDEVAAVRERVGDTRLAELGLEYRVVGEYLRSERTQDSLFPALSSRLKQYARRQRAWLRKLQQI